MNPLDVQVGGSHYKKMPIQPMEFSMANKLDACQHTIIKYVTRFREKGGIQDLEKAKHVIDMMIEFEQRLERKAARMAEALEETSEQAQDECSCSACTLRTQLKELFGADIEVMFLAEDSGHAD